MKSIVIIFTAVLGLFVANGVNAEPIRVTLLGTGSPVPSPTRFGPATLVEAGEEKLIFDVGRGATIRLRQAEVPLKNVTVFLTHLHSDHINGLGDLWSYSYITPISGDPTPVFNDKPLKVFGPTGTAQLTRGLKIGFQPDIDIRVADRAKSGLSAQLGNTAFDATDIDHDGVVFNKGGVQVTAIRVKHGESKTFGYRVMGDYDGHSVVISGD